MAYKYQRFNRETSHTEENNSEYIVELGTYLPIAKRVEDLRNAGMNLMAYRQAYAEFANGTENIDLDEYDNELLGIDEIDFMNLKKRYFDIMKQKQQAEAEAIKQMKQMKEEQKIQAEIAKREAQKKNEEEKK